MFRGFNGFFIPKKIEQNTQNEIKEQVETAPLVLKENLSLNSNKIINLNSGTSSNDAVNFGQLSSVQSSVNNIQSNKGYQEYIYNVTGSSNTITDDRYFYRVLSNAGSVSANITGCPNTNGTVIFIEAATGTSSTLSLNLHGNLVANLTSGGTSGRFMAYRTNSIWYFVSI